MKIEDRLDIAKKLQHHHYFFRSFWDIGNPIVGKHNGLSTAAITFDSSGDAINLIIDEDFWNNLDEHTKLFVICHEMSHIILNHGYRFIEYFNTPDFCTMNTAADVVINEMLCKSFGFFRNKLLEQLNTRGCWMDTVFKDDYSVLSNESTEYYFNYLKKNARCDIDNLFRIDEHKILSDADAQGIIDVLHKNGVFQNIDPSLIKKMPKDSDSFVRSASGEGAWQDVHTKKTVKKKWETIIKKWESFQIKETIESNERWDRVNPRYSQIISDGIHLPTNHNVLDDYRIKDKIDVFFFLDTSGSCIGLKDRFFTAANSLNPKRFNIRLFCFDTKVVEINIKDNKVYGGGGTSFSIIENKIQSIMQKENKSYPTAVWIITDGYGSAVSPQKPENWNWFLTSKYVNYIPTASKVYKLSDFE